MVGLDGPARAAIVLLIVDEDAAAAMLAGLSPGDLSAIAAAMPRIASIDPHTISNVIDEFVATGAAQAGAGVAGPQQFDRALAQAVGPARGSGIRARAAPEPPRRRVGTLDWMDPPTLAAALASEHPQVIAATLATAGPELGGSAIRYLPPHLVADVIQRVATLRPLRPQVLDDIEVMLAQRLAVVVQDRAVEIGGHSAAAKLLSGLGRAGAGSVVRDIRNRDIELAEAIDAQLLTFDDLTGLAPKALAALLADVDNETLVVALKGLDPDGRAQMLSGLSSRAAATILDDIDARPPARVADIQSAQRRIVQAARRLGDSGAIDLGGGE